MNPLHYLLLCEGPTDILVIEKIANKISIDTGRKITIQVLAPQRDATSRYEDFGWKEVRNWCRLHGTSIDTSANTLEALAARKRNWRALVATAKADGLIIQMDTDIAKEIVDLSPSYTGSTKKSRKKFCFSAFLSWLGETVKPDNIYFLLSTYSTENWVLATHDRGEDIFNNLNPGFDYEDIDNASDRLIALGYASYIHPETGKQKLNKDLNIYKQYALNIETNLDKVRLECEEAENLCIKFEQ